MDISILQRKVFGVYQDEETSEIQVLIPEYIEKPAATKNNGKNRKTLITIAKYSFRSQFVNALRTETVRRSVIKK